VAHDAGEVAPDDDEMEPGQKFIRRLLIFLFMIPLFIVAFVLDEVAGKGWAALGIFAIGGVIGGMGHFLWKEFRK
jgi:ABC-type Fe3+ transport system permease subunit